MKFPSRGLEWRAVFQQHSQKFGEKIHRCREIWAEQYSIHHSLPLSCLHSLFHIASGISSSIPVGFDFWGKLREKTSMINYSPHHWSQSQDHNLFSLSPFSTIFYKFLSSTASTNGDVNQIFILMESNSFPGCHDFSKQSYYTFPFTVKMCYRRTKRYPNVSSSH